MNRTLESDNQLAFPRGRVTLMFTDVEGSTAAWERHGSSFGEALQTHDSIVRTAVSNNRGYIVKNVGDGFMAVFAAAADAVRGAIDIQTQLAAVPLTEAWQTVGGVRVRIGLHTGEPAYRDDDYFGSPVNRASRIADAAHGGMVLCSDTTYAEAGDLLSESIITKDHLAHRLKDLGAPVHLFEIRDPGFESLWCDRPLRTLESLQHNFPEQVTSLVGRRRERDDLNALLSKNQSRLITLTGPGGTGKTRLALQIAADRLQDYKDGVWLVDLSVLKDPAAVASTIAHALHVEVPPSADARAALLNFLRTKRVLLILDNFEQVADAAPMVSDLLRECSGLTCLVTSREILHLTGERDYPVEPLSAPPAAPSAACPTASPIIASAIDWTSYESVQLFVERSHSVKPDFVLSDSTGPVVGEICRRLDGIPLAVELAAARVRGISPAQILERLTRRFDILASTLRDVPARQQTLRSTIDWSYDLLTESEQKLFCELAVFTGGFFLDAAENVCQTQGAFDLVFSLRDKSLLKTADVMGELRYYMLETIRDYALQKLLTLGEVEGLRDRHAEFYLKRAADWSEKLASAGTDADKAAQIFRADLDNMRAGMDWADAKGRPSVTMEYGKALFPYLRRHGMVEECETRLAVADDAARQVGNLHTLARLLNQRGLLHMERADLLPALRFFEESRGISSDQGDQARVLVASINLGNVHWMLGEFSKARERWEDAQRLTISTNQPRYEAFIRENLGILACQGGRLEEAEKHYSASLEMHRRNGNQEGIASTLYNSSEVARTKGEFSRAVDMLEQSHAIYTGLDHQRGIAFASLRLGLAHMDMGNTQAARQRIDEGLHIARVTGNRHGEMYGTTYLAKLAVLAGDLESAKTLFNKAYALGAALSDRKHRADMLRYVAELLSVQGDIRGAARLNLWLEPEYREMGIAVEERVRRDAEALAASLDPEDLDSLRRNAASFRPDVDIPFLRD